jgi:hypothetical protein
MIRAIFLGLIAGLGLALFNYLLFGKICTGEQLLKMNPLIRIPLGGCLLFLTVFPMSYLRQYFMQQPSMEHGSANCDIYSSLMVLIWGCSLVWVLILPTFKTR